MENIGEESELMRYVKEFENSYYPPEIYSTIRDEYHEIKDRTPSEIMDILSNYEITNSDKLEAYRSFIRLSYFLISISMPLLIAIEHIKNRGSIYDYICQRANGYSLGSDQLMTLGDIFDCIVDHDLDTAKILLKIIEGNNNIIFSDLVDSIESNDKALFISIVKDNKLNVEIINKCICFAEEEKWFIKEGEKMEVKYLSYFSNPEDVSIENLIDEHQDTIKRIRPSLNNVGASEDIQLYIQIFNDLIHTLKNITDEGFEDIYNKVLSLYKKNLFYMWDDPDDIFYWQDRRDIESIVDIEDFRDIYNQTKEEYSAYKKKQAEISDAEVLQIDTNSQTQIETPIEQEFKLPDDFFKRESHSAECYIQSREYLDIYVKDAGAATFTQLINRLSDEQYIDNTIEAKESFAFQLTTIKASESTDTDAKVVHWRKDIESLCYLIKRFVVGNSLSGGKYKRPNQFFTLAGDPSAEKSRSNYADCASINFKIMIEQLYPVYSSGKTKPQK